MRSRRSLIEWALLTAALATLGGLAAWQDWFWRADHMLYDIGLGLSSRQPPADIVIVAVDEESLARIGRWPWRRAVHATLIEKLTEAKAAAVGFDIMFSEADSADPDGDRILAAAIARNGRVVLPVAQRTLGPGLVSEGLPVAMFADAAARLGHIETELDPDGIARSVYLWAGLGEPGYPQFSLALLQLVHPPLAARYARGTSNAKTEPYAWQRERQLHLPFAGPPGSYRFVSYVDVLTGAVPAQSLRDQMVLVGATATGLGDIYPTPMSTLGRPMPGVEMHATALDALRAGDEIQSVSQDMAAAITAGTLFLLMLALMHLSPRSGLLMSGATAATAIVGSLLLMRWHHSWLPPVPMLVGTLLAYPLWSWRRLEAAQRFMDGELQQLRESEPGAFAGEFPAQGFDPMDNRIAIVRAATERQLAIRKDRDETMRFVSHDLRSPLVSIITLVEGASSQAVADCQARLLQVGHYAQRALDLADDFFRLAKAEAADPRRFSEVDLSTTVLEAADEAWVIAERKKIVIAVQNDCLGEALVQGDRSLLHRALMNLLGNAIKFSPEGGKVRVVLREVDGWTEIEVADNGCGIPLEQQDKLFTRFSHITLPDQPAQPGVGLGLFIVKTIVERHGGRVTVQSAPGKGSTFLMRLPAAGRLHPELDIAPQ